MEEKDKSVNEIEMQRRSLRKWQSAIEAAHIPVSERSCSKEDFKNMIARGGKKIPDIYSNIAWGDGDNLANDWSFIIDGEGDVGLHTPSQVRRRVGLTILQNGVTYVCQHHDFYPPYGLYVDYRTVVSYLVNKDQCYHAVDMLSEQHILFISEIFPDKNLNEVVRSMLTFRLDDVMRRRRDNGLVTILSFARPCAFVMNQNLLGDEIQSLLMKCYDHGSSKIEEYKIVRLVTGTGTNKIHNSPNNCPQENI